MRLHFQGISKKQHPEAKYIHSEDVNNPGLLVPIFVKMFDPESVCDVGCGVGAFLDAFKAHNVKKIMGFDGAWADRALISKHLSHSEFAVIDLENEVPEVTQKFDLALNLEVAEHISPEKSDNVIDFLTALSDTVIFSAAIPSQGGYQHLNEQWEEYWEEKFNKKGYKKYDIIRHKICTNKNISWWYRQNIVVYSRRDFSHFPEVALTNMISQELFMSKVNVNKQLVKRLQGGILLRLLRKMRKK